MSQVELAAATGASRETVRRRLAQPPAIEPCRKDGKTVWYSTAPALRRILGPAGAAGEGEVLDLAAERARLARAQTEGQALKNSTATGELIEVAAAKAMFSRLVLTTKERLRSVPSIALGRVGGLTKHQAREIGELIDEALTELADGAAPRSADQARRRPRSRALR